MYNNDYLLPRFYHRGLIYDNIDDLLYSDKFINSFTLFSVQLTGVSGTVPILDSSWCILIQIRSLQFAFSITSSKSTWRLRDDVSLGGISEWRYF